MNNYIDITDDEYDLINDEAIKQIIEFYNNYELYYLQNFVDEIANLKQNKRTALDDHILTSSFIN